MNGGLVVVIVLGTATAAHADGDRLAVLHDPGKSWAFEVVSGPSIAALKPVKDAPPSRCSIVAWQEADKIERAKLECRTEPSDAAKTNAVTPTLLLVFDAQGVRQVFAADRALDDASNLLAFTFPSKLTVPWKRDGKHTDGGRAEVTVREQPITIAGTTERAWLAESKNWFASQQGKGAPMRGTMMFAPGHGPIVICTAVDDKRHHCLRRTQLDPKDRYVEPPDALARPTNIAPRPPKTGVVTVAGKVAHDKSSLKIDAVAAKAVLETRGCYRTLLQKKPGAKGAVKVTLTVNAVGKTEDVTVGAFDETLGACIRTPVAAARFSIPMSEYGEPRTARFTINLKLAPE